MKKFIGCICIHLYVFSQAPKAWWKYVSYCILQNKEPNIAILNKIIIISNISKDLHNE